MSSPNERPLSVNAVELILKTYLSLPERITNIDISKKEFDEICLSFPKLLNSIENEFNFSDVQILYPRHLRNVLGHAAWWWENGTFVFRKQDGTLEHLTYGEFRTELTEFEQNFLEIFNEFEKRRTASP